MRILRGYILDFEGNPVPGATVQAFDGQALSGTNPGTTSNSEGNFQFDIGEFDRLRVSFVGMAPATIVVEPEDTFINVQLLPNTSLPEVTANADYPKPKSRPDWAKYIFWLIFIALAIAAYYSIK